MISIESLDPKGNKIERNPKPFEGVEIEEVKLFSEDDDQLVKIRKNLLIEFKQRLIALLKKYHECFAWSIVNILNIDPNIAITNWPSSLILSPSIRRRGGMARSGRQ